MANNESWASDDNADDLLAGILNDTEEEAADEQRRIEAEIQAKEEAKRLAEEEEAIRRKAEAEARVTAEMDRQGDLEKRRTLRMEALRVEDLKAKGEWVEPVDEAAEAAKAAEAERKKQQEQARQAELAAAQHAPSPEQQAAARAAQAQSAPQESKSNKLGIVLGLLVLVAIGLGGALFMMTQNSYEIDQTPYAKTVYQPQDQEVKLVTMGFTPLPKVEKKVEKEPEKKTRRRRSRSSSRSRSRSKSKSKSKKENKSGLKLDLSGTDPFGAGF